MVSGIEEIRSNLQAAPKRWLVTGAAGFIGSNLVEALLSLDQEVIGLDNFSTGKAENLEDVKKCVHPAAWARFRFQQGDILDFQTCLEASRGVEVILHQAALGSVPRSLEDPAATNRVNVEGFLNVMLAGRNNGVQRLVYASSSSVYGDSRESPKQEDALGRPLSPYAVSKCAGELYAAVFYRLYELELIGLRYFNVFGPRQNPVGPYAAVIPRWVTARLENGVCTIYGDGTTSRDFCYVANAVQANLLAACAETEAVGRVYNVAAGKATKLNELYGMLAELSPSSQAVLRYEPFRAGDVRHSLADISLARRFLGYQPEIDLKTGLKETMEWYKRRV